MHSEATQNMRGPYPRYARRNGLDTPDMRELILLICVEIHQLPQLEVGNSALTLESAICPAQTEYLIPVTPCMRYT